MKIIVILFLYIAISVLVGLNLVPQNCGKYKGIKRINIYLRLKLVVNVIFSITCAFYLVRLRRKRTFFFIILPSVLSMGLGILDSILLYNAVKRLRNLEVSPKEYYKQVAGDNILMYFFWFAANIFFYCFRVSSSDQLYFVCYFLFWILVDGVVVWLRRNTMKCRKVENENLKCIMEQYPIDAFTIYEYDGKARKTANAMVDSFFGRGNMYFSDYLLSNLTLEEVTGIYFHELGHIRMHHILVRNVLLLSIMPLLYYIGSIMDFIEKFQHINIPLGIAIMFGSLIFYVVIIYLYISRMQEYQADNYSVEQTKNGEALCSALEKLNQLNDILENDKSDKNLLRGHPTVARRISRIRKKMNMEG